MATNDVTPQEIYYKLAKAGFSMKQASGVMGNMYYESSLNPESGGIDTNGKWAGGLISWNTGSYPNAHELVTGNPQADLNNQIEYLVNDTDNLHEGLRGKTAQDVGHNFAQYVEGCSSCAPGDQGWIDRGQEAQSIYGYAKSKKWPSGLGIETSGTDTLTSISSGLSSASTLISDLSSADFWERAGLIVFGGLLILVGILILAREPINNAASEALGATTSLKRAGIIGGPTQEEKDARERRMQLAEANTQIGATKADTARMRELRLANARPRRHKSGKEEPNPNPPHN